MGAYCHESTEEQKQAIVKRLMADKSSTTAPKLGIAPAKCLSSVLQLLSAEADFDKFAALKVAVDDQKRTDMIVKREGVHHEQASQMTPRLIKQLRPRVAGCYLNWQPTLSQFAGYFSKPDIPSSSGDKKKGEKKKIPRKKMHSTARMYGGKWTQMQALNLVVAQLWKWHEKYGGAPGLQTKSEIA